MRWLIRAVVSAVVIGLAVVPVTHAHATPSPSKQQWWFDSWSIEKEVWPLTKGKGVTVAVIDSGVNAKLPDLAPVVLPGADLRDENGDGRQDHDDKLGGHGTGMASLIASQGTETGFVGIAPEAKILPIAASLDGRTTGTAIRFAVDHGAKVINISQASTAADIYPNLCPPELFDAIRYAASKDIVIVAGAGNFGTFNNKPAYPASCPGVVAVGALAHDGKPWQLTQRQDYVAVGAPGEDVGFIGRTGHVFTAGAGTSQASALTSGAVALLRSHFPEMSARQIVQRLIATAKDFGPPGKDDLLGYGVISIPRALKQDVPETAPNPVYERFDKVVSDMAAATPSTAATPATAAGKDDSGGVSLLVVGGVVLFLLIVLGGGAFLLLRHRRTPAVPSGRGSPMSYPPQPSGGPRQPSYQSDPMASQRPAGPPPGGPQSPASEYDGRGGG